MKKMNPDRKKKLDLALRKTEKKYDEVLKNLAKWKELEKESESSLELE